MLQLCIPFTWHFGLECGCRLLASAHLGHSCTLCASVWAHHHHDALAAGFRSYTAAVMHVGQAQVGLGDGCGALASLKLDSPAGCVILSAGSSCQDDAVAAVVLVGLIIHRGTRHKVLLLLICRVRKAWAQLRWVRMREVKLVGGWAVEQGILLVMHLAGSILHMHVGCIAALTLSLLLILLLWLIRLR